MKKQALEAQNAKLTDSFNQSQKLLSEKEKTIDSPEQRLKSTTSIWSLFGNRTREQLDTELQQIRAENERLRTEQARIDCEREAEHQRYKQHINTLENRLQTAKIEQSRLQDEKFRLEAELSQTKRKLTELTTTYTELIKTIQLAARQ